MNWDPQIGNLTEIRLRGFLYEGTIFQKKNQPEVSKKVVSILWVLTVYLL